MVAPQNCSFFEKCEEYLHKQKECFLSKFKTLKGRVWGLVGCLLVVPTLVEIVIYYLIQRCCTTPWILCIEVFLIILLSLDFFFLCLVVTIWLCHCQITQRGWFRNVFFIVILLLGVVSYVGIAQVTAGASEKQINPVGKILSPVHHSCTAVAAFFPSRGSYEIEADGTMNNKFNLPWYILSAYYAFHASIYIFASYFVLSLWGYRSINRLRFGLTLDKEKNVFWCIKPELKMLNLAKDILKTAKAANEIYQPVFSVDETKFDEHKPIFQEMNFQKFCLKMRKPDQIHESCLLSARHFFLTEDADWNICMADQLLKKISKLKRKTQLYIRINNDARTIYYTRWANQYKNTTIEIIFIDECALIVDKFTKDYHILKAFPECIDKNAAVCKENGFKFLIIGFGGLGKEVLKHLICDTQFLDSQGKRVDVGIDIVEKDATQIALFRKQFDDLLTRFNGIQFITTSKNIPIAAGTEEFYSFFEQNHKKYDRIVVALGDTAVSVETIAQIEDIVRKNIDLSSSDPQGELRAWKNKIFLISPELCDSMFPEEENNKHDNLFTVIGAGNKIFNYSDIINEDMFKLAQVINCRYDTDTIEEVDMTKAVEKWEGADFYSRQSSYAAGLGLENVRLLLRVKDDCTKEEYKKLLDDDKLKQRLGKIEHNRWWAYMLGSGYSPWTNPVQRLKEDLKKANQSTKFLRHATMVEWEYLPEMDNAFRNVITISIQQKKRDLAFKLSLTALVCDAEPINSAQLPIEGIVSISVFNDGKLSLNREALQKKLDELRSQLEGAVIELEKVPDSADWVMSAKKSGMCFISEKIKDISKKYFAEFSVKEKSPKQTGEYTVNGYKIKTGSIEITEIVKSEDIIPSVEEAPQVKNVEQTLNFSGVLKCSSQWEPSKNFQDKDLELIEDIPTLFKIARGENG